MRSGGTVTMNGSFTGNLVLDTTTGGWLLGAGGSLVGSRVTVFSSLTIINSFTLDGVTIAGGSDLLATPGSSNVTIRNGLTIDGRLLVGNGTSNGRLSLSGSQTIGGVGQLVMETGAAVSVLNSDAATFTFGPNLVLRGRAINISGAATQTFRFQGTIRPDLASASASVIGTNIGTVELSGSVQPEGGTSLTFNPTSLVNAGTITVTAGNTVTLGSTLTSQTIVNRQQIIGTGGTLTIGGTWTSTGTINVSSTNVTLTGAFTQTGMGSATPAAGQGTFLRSGGTILISGSSPATSRSMQRPGPGYLAVEEHCAIRG